MGFWHTGYMEHHEDAFSSAVFPSSGAPPRPPSLPCPDCERTFLSQEDLERHRFDGHASSRPVLLWRGRECGRSRLTFTEPTTEQDWEVLDCRSMTINGRSSKPSKAGSLLSQFRDGVVSVILTGKHAEQVFDLRFSVADPADLDGVEVRLLEMVKKQQLTIASIEGFLAASAQFVTARDYRDGITAYLHAVLARERSPESGLRHAAYRERFDQAVALLGSFDRAPADTICGLVAFHYNQFDWAVQKTRSHRVAWGARRLVHLLRVEPLGEEKVGDSHRSSLDFVLSDALTEQVLTWTCIPLDGSAATAVDEMESSLCSQELFDQLKLRLIASEHHRRTGAIDRVRPHIDELRHNPIAEAWAAAYQARIRRLGAE